MSFVYPGQSLYIPAGKRVIRNGTPSRQTRPTTITVRATKPARDGKTRVFWKSNGYKASALV
jgi:hypothetical protein